MAEILGAKAGKLNLSDAFMISGVKVLSEKLLSTVIGNGSVMSGAIKLGGAVAVNKIVGGKIADIVGTAWTVDGTEDIVTAFFPKFSQGFLGDVKSQVELV